MAQNLYHGSKIAKIKTLKPLPHNAVDGEAVVFATLDVRFALAMIHGTGNELAVGYFIDQNTHKEEMYIDELVPNAFKLLEAPGSLYTLTDTGFISDARLSHVELISKLETQILEEVRYEDILSELKKHEINLINYDNVLTEMKKRRKDHQEAMIPHKPDRFTK